MWFSDILHKNPTKTQGMHFVSVKHWNLKVINTNKSLKIYQVQKVQLFHLFRNFETHWKLWKLLNISVVSKQIETSPISGVSKHSWNGLKHDKNWLRPNVSVVSKRFKTKLKQALKQNWQKLWKSMKIPGPISGVSKHWNSDYTGKKLKRTETGRKMTKSKPFSCFETKLKQALEKVKIPGPISGIFTFSPFPELVSILFRNISKQLKRLDLVNFLPVSVRFSFFTI